MTDLKISPRIVDLVCSRICHDVINPVSAINNGIELVSEMGEGVDGEAFGLIADSAAIVAARLGMMRYCFGAASPSLDEVRNVTLAYFEGGKIMIEWPRTGLAADLNETREAFPKMVLNSVLLAAEAVGIAGTVTLASPSPATLTITGVSSKYPIRTDVLVGLGAAPETLEAKTIQAYFTGLVAERFGYGFKKTVDDTKLVIAIT